MIPQPACLGRAQARSYSRYGVTMEQMHEELGVGRRTVERLREQVSDLFPGLSYTQDENRVRRWRLPPRAMPAMPPGHGTLGTLEGLARDLAAVGDEARAGDVREALCARRFVRQLPSRRDREDGGVRDGLAVHGRVVGFAFLVLSGHRLLRRFPRRLGVPLSAELATRPLRDRSRARPLCDRARSGGVRGGGSVRPGAAEPSGARELLPGRSPDGLGGAPRRRVRAAPRR